MEKTLAEAKAEYRIVVKGKGGRCPCCDRFGKVHPQPLNAGIARCLIFLYKYARTEYVHTPSHGDRKFLTNNNVGKLALWGLAEAATNPVDPKKKRLGFWKITEQGAAFVEGRIKVPHKVLTYNKRVLGVRDDKMLTIQDALKIPFDYTKLMNDEAGIL